MVNKEIVRLEYEKAQDSAEHYNTMTWTLIAAGIGLSLLLLKFTLFDLAGKEFFQVNHYSLQNLMIFIGVFVIIYFRYLVEAADEKKRFKYGICKIIEERYDFYGQNLKVSDLLISKMGSGPSLFRLSSVVVVLLFAAASLFLMANFSDEIINDSSKRSLINITIVYGSFIAQIVLVKYFFKQDKNYRNADTNVGEMLNKIRGVKHKNK
jgi:hypothetical protein